MKNFVQPADFVTIATPSGGVSSGQGVLIGALFGVATKTAFAGEKLSIMTEGAFDLPKHSGDSFAVGDKVYFNATESTLTSTATNNKWIGVALFTAAGSAATARIRLNGVAI